jgi:CYTH domain-containing protein/predicted ATPase
MMEKLIKEIVLTGGPCSGKTTGRNYLAEKLRDRGFRVLLAPEVATMIISGGLNDLVKLMRSAPYKYLETERQMLLMQMDLRNRFLKIAEPFIDEKPVIIYDRGPMDYKVYIDPEQFEAMLKEFNLTIYDVRDSFDGVVHLVTAAKGAEEFYTLANNEARSESPEEARLLDDSTLNAWLGHQHLRIIDNSTDFKQKMKRTLQTICRFLGIPAPLEIERKFLLLKAPSLAIPELQQAQKIAIEQMYLESAPGQEERIRKRTQYGFSVYYFTRKSPISSGVRSEREEEIRELEYIGLQKRRIPGSRIIKKNRYCFAYNNQYFELDIFIEPRGRCFLEIELTDRNDVLSLPPFLEIEKEVTGDERYSNRAIVTS